MSGEGEMINVVCALLWKEGNILAARRGDHVVRKGLWEFPGGKVEEGETAEEAIIREMKEEMGLTVRVIKKFPVIKHDYEDFTIRLMPFACHWIEGDISLKDHDRYKWMSRNELFCYKWSAADEKLLILLADHLTDRNGIIV